MTAALEQALGVAYRYLGRRDRTVAEVRSHLLKKEISPELIESAIAEIERQDYLNDARYAQRFAEDRRKLDRWGSERICRRLIELGIDSELAQQASEPEDASQEIQLALELLRRRLRVPPEEPRERDRALKLLLRRGYGYGRAREALKRFEETPA